MTRVLGWIGVATMAPTASVAMVSPAGAETPSEKADVLLKGVIKPGDPGLAVLVAQNGKILFEKGYGLADREDDVPVTPQTIFRIGAISRQFTASAILKLQEDGKLSVNDKLSKYIPDFPRGNEVSLRQLLTHTSGLHNYPLHVTTPTTTGAIIETIKKYPYDFDPGARYLYENSSYVLLGCIVEKVSGQTYGDFLRENFFQPLGMTNTGVCRAYPRLPHEALGYSLGADGFKPALNWNMSWAPGWGALYSTVEDLYRWNEGIFEGRALNGASLEAAFTPVKVYEGQLNSDGGYGFGWVIGRYRGLREIYHSGGLDGFSGRLLRMPDERFTVAILANSRPGRENASPELLARQLEDIFLADKLAPEPILNTNVSPNSYDALTGSYHFQGMFLTISRRGTHLFEQFGRKPAVELFPESDTQFFTKEWHAKITFVKDSNGKVVKLIHHQWGIDTEGLPMKEQ